MENLNKQTAKCLLNYKLEEERVYKIKGHSIDSIILLAYRMGKHDERCRKNNSSKQILIDEERTANSVKQDLWDFYNFRQLNYI